MRNKEIGYRVEQSHASGRRYLYNLIHTERSGGCAWGGGDKNKVTKHDSAT